MSEELAQLAADFIKHNNHANCPDSWKACDIARSFVEKWIEMDDAARTAEHPADDGEAIRTMEMKPTERGFAAIYCENYPKFEQARLVQESSAIREYDDAMEKPGSSCLWIGDDFHLNREQVRELVGVLQHWLRNKTLRNY